jgi:hypothetical protein
MEQSQHHLRMSMMNGNVEGRFVYFAFGINVSACLDKQSHR